MQRLASSRDWRSNHWDMPPIVARTTTPRWPFWLLLAAWFCANSPQAATYAVLTWMAEARNFSHQQRLTGQVASVLVGEPAAAIAAAPDDAAQPSKLPPVPANAVLKKLDLAVEGTFDMPGPIGCGQRRANRIFSDEGLTRAAPPHGPPRVLGIG